MARERDPYLLVVLVVTLLYTEGCAHPYLRASQYVDRAVQVLETVPARNKRWDYGADGCHCNGYSVECLQDVFCQRKQKSSQWVCQRSCCGFKCVSKN